MPNPAGSNQSPFWLQKQYGDVKRETTLLKEAPISGSPLAAQALNAPRRAGQGAKRSRPTQVQPQPQAPVQTPTPQASIAAVWGQIAALPGISDLVRSYAAQASMQAQGQVG